MNDAPHERPPAASEPESTPPRPALSSDQLAPPRRLAFGRVAVWGIVGVMALLLARAALHRRPKTPRLLPPPSYREFGLQDGRLGIGPDQRFLMGQRDFSGVLADAESKDYVATDFGPRNIANFSTRVGDYTVGVRRVSFVNAQAELFSNPIAPVPLSGCQVLLEIYSPDDAALRRIRDFATQCTATDDKGKTVVSIPNQPGRLMTRGVMRYVVFAPFSPQARFLRRLEGEIVVAESDSRDAPFSGRPAHPRLAASPDEDGGRESKMPPSDVFGTETRREDSGVKAKTKRLKFHLENITLPVGVHVFGLASAAYVPTAQIPSPTSGNAPGVSLPAASGRTGGVFSPPSEPAQSGVQLLPEEQARKFAALFPPVTEFAGPLELPTRLLLLPDVENRFAIPLPTPPDSEVGFGPTVSCRLIPHLGLDGEINLTGDATLPPDPATGPSPQDAKNGASPQPVVVPISCRVWDNAPEVLVLLPPAAPPSVSVGAASSPASAKPPGRRLAIRLHLFFEMSPPGSDYQPPTLTPYPPPSGQVGGEMKGQILVQNAPLRYGAAQLEIVREGASGTGGVTDWVWLDGEGRWRFANLAPGRYTIRVRDIQPYRSAAVTPGPVADYLRRRYGVAHPVWLNAIQSGLLVTGGNLTLPLPARLVDADKSAAH